MEPASCRKWLQHFFFNSQSAENSSLISGQPEGQSAPARNYLSLPILRKYMAVDLSMKLNSIQGERYNSLYPGFNDESVLLMT